MAITDRIYLKNHTQICSQMDCRVPKKVFSGATLDLVFTGDIDRVDASIRKYIYAFAKDFLNCDCESNPYCKHPEKKFMEYMLELRSEGRTPEEIIHKMGEDYMVYSYISDVVSFIDDSIRTLEVVEAIASLDDRNGTFEKAVEAKKSLL
mgnify:CR=1 FL=1